MFWPVCHMSYKQAPEKTKMIYIDQKLKWSIKMIKNFYTTLARARSIYKIQLTKEN